MALMNNQKKTVYVGESRHHTHFLKVMNVRLFIFQAVWPKKWTKP